MEPKQMGINEELKSLSDWEEGNVGFFYNVVLLVFDAENLSSPLWDVSSLNYFDQL